MHFLLLWLDRIFMCSIYSSLSAFCSSIYPWVSATLVYQHTSSIRRPFSKFRFYLSALHKMSFAVWCKVYFTLTSLTSVNLTLISSTCSSVMLIEACWLAESYPKICYLFFRVTMWVLRKARWYFSVAQHCLYLSCLPLSHLLLYLLFSHFFSPPLHFVSVHSSQ